MQMISQSMTKRRSQAGILVQRLVSGGRLHCRKWKGNFICSAVDTVYYLQSISTVSSKVSFLPKVRFKESIQSSESLAVAERSNTLKKSKEQDASSLSQVDTAAGAPSEWKMAPSESSVGHNGLSPMSIYGRCNGFNPQRCACSEIPLFTKWSVPVCCSVSPFMPMEHVEASFCHSIPGVSCVSIPSVNYDSGQNSLFTPNLVFLQLLLADAPIHENVKSI